LPIFFIKDKYVLVKLCLSGKIQIHMSTKSLSFDQNIKRTIFWQSPNLCKAKRYI